ncbi:MAG TPA: hypothetical protein VM529_16330 [Gemmata sp.]|nr:hypothetical protein [Gemmata sp.]
MRRRTLLSVQSLESRENPSDIITIDPVGIIETQAAATAPAVTTTTDPVADAIAATTAVIDGMTETSNDDTGSIYSVPLNP